MFYNRLAYRRIISRMMAPNPAVVAEGFILGSQPPPFCHVPTIVEAKHGLVAAWFAGTIEGHPDVSIQLARHDGACGLYLESMQYPPCGARYLRLDRWRGP